MLRLLQFGAGNPADVVILLVGRTGVVSFHQMSLKKHVFDELRHGVDGSAKTLGVFFEHRVIIFCLAYAFKL